MGVYIPEMQMPRNCYDCQIESYVPNCPVYMYFSATEYMKDRHPNCPLVDIPTPHGRLIDATILSQYRELDYMNWDKPTHVIRYGRLKSMPTIISMEE